MIYEVRVQEVTVGPSPLTPHKRVLILQRMGTMGFEI